MNFDVEMAPTAEADLERLLDFLIDRAETTEDFDRAQAAIDAIKAAALHRLAVTPYSFRKAAQNPAQRELIIPFGGTTGYVALYEIVSTTKVVILAVRHQLEEDYH
jgi:plasmid stabilization system protein ParE